MSRALRTTSHHIALPSDPLDTLGHRSQSSRDALRVIQHLRHRRFYFSLAPWLSSGIFPIILHMDTVPLDTSYLAFPLHRIVPYIGPMSSLDIPPFDSLFI